MDRSSQRGGRGGSSRRARNTATPSAPAAAHGRTRSSVTPPSANTASREPAIARAARMASRPRGGLSRAPRHARPPGDAWRRWGSRAPHRRLRRRARRTSSSECAATEIQAGRPKAARASATFRHSPPRCTPSAPTSRAKARMPVHHEERAGLPGRDSQPARQQAKARDRAPLVPELYAERSGGRAAATASVHRTMASSPNAGSVTRTSRGFMDRARGRRRPPPVPAALVPPARSGSTGTARPGTRASRAPLRRRDARGTSAPDPTARRRGHRPSNGPGRCRGDTAAARPRERAATSGATSTRTIIRRPSFDVRRGRGCLPSPAPRTGSTRCA